MSFLMTVRSKSVELAVSARHAIIMSMLDAWQRCGERDAEPEEPDFVASLVLYGTRRLERDWAEMLTPEGCRVSITGVYCHQTPKINYLGMQGRSCEIGDLLWCHVHTDASGQTTRNALLLQAKAGSDQPHTLQRSELDQLKLYARWPEFTYQSPSSLSGQSRHVTPSAPRLGAQYILVDPRPAWNPLSGLQGVSGTYPVGVCVAANPLSDHTDLGLELVHTLEFRSGSPFDDRETAMAETGWSRVVWDLLLTSATKLFRRRRSGHAGESRSSGAPPEAMDGAHYVNSNGPPRFLSQLGDSDFEDGPGVSLLLVETSEAQG